MADDIGTSKRTNINLWIDDQMLREIDRFWHKNEFRTRTEAMRVLITRGLQNPPKDKPKK